MPQTSVYKDVKIYSGGFDLSGASNMLELGYEFDEVEVKAFGNQCRFWVPGLPRLSVSLEGNAASNGTNEAEDVIVQQLAIADRPMTFCPLTGAAGEVAYFAKALPLSYQWGGGVGELASFSASARGENVPLVRGLVMATGQKTTSGNGTAYNLGSVSSSQKLYCCLHVVQVSGSLTVVIQSDDASGFSSPATRATFAAATSVGAEYLSPVSGPITDTWWRANWTVSGSATFVVVVGIQ